jgi:hypothetical protein
MSLSLPTLLADGSTLMVDHDFITRLHEGDASIGWLGDERLGVYCTPGGIEIRRLCEDNELRVIMRPTTAAALAPASPTGSSPRTTRSVPTQPRLLRSTVTTRPTASSSR